MNGSSSSDGDNDSRWGGASCAEDSAGGIASWNTGWFAIAAFVACSGDCNGFSGDTGWADVNEIINIDGLRRNSDRNC